VGNLNRKLVARRNFLIRLGSTVGAYWLGSLASWPRLAPLVRGEVVEAVSGNVTWPRGQTIPAGTRLRFDPNVSTTVTVSGGNVVVEGVLEMRPAAPGVVHTLRFTNISEAAFVGGGNNPVASDLGLWVMTKGRLDVQGSRKEPWARAAQGIAVGQQTILLDRDPVGWGVGDEVAITPTEPPSVKNHWKRHDLRKVAAISGQEITLDSGCAFPHPTVTIPGSNHTGFPGAIYGAEVLNLTRDTRIEGTPGGRSHIFIRSTQPQHMGHVAVRHMGPRKETGRLYKGRPITKKVLGRWPIHLHHSGHGAHGTLIDGVVVRDAGSHAFVAHDSHGVTFRGCIAHDVFENAYWWDTDHHTDLSSDILYENCVASSVHHDPPNQGFRLAGFMLPGAHNNTIRGCVAVGVVGAKDSSGFNWPEKMHGVWEFTDNLSHNNFRHGAFVWQNTKNLNVVTRLTAYHNGGAGIGHGAYSNAYNYVDCVLHGNGSGMELHALSRANAPDRLSFVRVLFDNQVKSVKHIAASTLDTPVLFKDCRLKAGVSVNDKGGFGSKFDFVNCDPLEPSKLRIVNLQTGARIRVQRKDGTAYQIDGSGTKTIPRFA
jgi:hypothetical protein